MGSRPAEIVIAGAGIAGLTTAIALARRGFASQVLERTSTFEEVGAGIQLSPNATRILDRLGVLERLLQSATRPEAIELRRADSLRLLATVPLGRAAERRWGAPYLTLRRADLQAALLDTADRLAEIGLVTGSTVRDVSSEPGSATLSADREGSVGTIGADLIVGADGVWSTLRNHVSGIASRFTSHIAWRAMLSAAEAAEHRGVLFADRVTAFLNPGFHLVAYPVHEDGTMNLVAIAPGPAIAHDWTGNAGREKLPEAMRGASDSLLAVAETAGPWTVWPIHDVPRRAPWSRGRAMLLVGDAAHAMSPHAAQGAAMAIEDAGTLATELARAPNDIGAALAAYEALRRPRIERVARRGSLNRFAWHAGGPVAFMRDRVLSLRSPERLAADFDWLYGKADSR